jgi:hypothetical protein
VLRGRWVDDFSAALQIAAAPINSRKVVIVFMLLISNFA